MAGKAVRVAGAARRSVRLDSRTGSPSGAHPASPVEQAALPALSHLLDGSDSGYAGGTPTVAADVHPGGGGGEGAAGGAIGCQAGAVEFPSSGAVVFVNNAE